MPTVAQLLLRAGELSQDSRRRDVEILLGHCLGKSRTWLYTWPEAEVEPLAQAQFEGLLASRKTGHPIAYLTGRREFWTLNLRVNRSTLIPRPETETLVEWALALKLPAGAAVLDLGTGSGAIALALASERPQWHISAVDVSQGALEVARENGLEHDLASVRFYHSNWYEAIEDQRFDLLVSNPPYIEYEDEHLDTGDLRFEPVMALRAEDRGLADLKRIINAAPMYLNPNGWVLLEHGYTQAQAVREVLASRGFCDIMTRNDDAGLERISGGRWHVKR